MSWELIFNPGLKAWNGATQQYVPIADAVQLQPYTDSSGYVEKSAIGGGRNQTTPDRLAIREEFYRRYPGGVIPGLPNVNTKSLAVQAAAIGLPSPSVLPGINAPLDYVPPHRNNGLLNAAGQTGGQTGGQGATGTVPSGWQQLLQPLQNSLGFPIGLFGSSDSGSAFSALQQLMSGAIVPRNSGVQSGLGVNNVLNSLYSAGLARLGLFGAPGTGGQPAANQVPAGFGLLRW